MEGTNCNGEGGWTRVAFVNMSQPGATCPTGLTRLDRFGPILCSREDTERQQSAFITTLGLNYSAVCGRVRGYQLGRPGAFKAFIDTNATIDQPYVDGVSITHGTSPRRHIWTYAVGLQETATMSSLTSSCPCNNDSSVTTPSFIGNNYYCESGIADSPTINTLYPNDPLWDGMQCNNDEGTCCTNPSLPWFDTALTETSNDDIELRLLFTRRNIDEGSPLDIIELYIR